MILSNVLDETVTVACVISDCIGQAKLITKNLLSCDLVLARSDFPRACQY